MFIPLHLLWWSVGRSSSYPKSNATPSLDVRYLSQATCFYDVEALLSPNTLLPESDKRSDSIA